MQVDFVYYLPTSTPSNRTVAFGGKSYALTADLARGTTPVDPGAGTSSPSPDPSTGTGPTPGGDCAAPAWSAGSEYGAGTTVSHGSHQWKAKWRTKGETPGSTGDRGAWQDLGACCPPPPVPPGGDRIAPGRRRAHPCSAERRRSARLRPERAAGSAVFGELPARRFSRTA
ncbi:chitinase C-terminal domain-containing protein [Streptomyces sp. NPDC058240]|uniref:chitinase C-terminal domain-containing protein n=1 Tax=Streptomyces sp. NPDC058240 TaxID=3346396 RepID=UPI0036EBDB20